MLKKLVIMLAVVSSTTFAYATSQDTNAVTIQNNNSIPAQQVVTPKTTIVNPANVGSKSGSNQIFGNPPVTGEKGKEYYTKEQRSNGQNSADIGSKVGSNQVFGNPPVTGEKNKKYYSKEELANPINDPDAPNSSKYGINGQSK